MPARYETIAAWVKQHKWTKGAELGLFDGRTHIYLLEKCPDLNLVGVDVWDLPGFKEGPTKSGEKCFCQWCNETRVARKAESASQMRKRVIRSTAVYGQRSIILQMPTAEAADHVDAWSLDFAFIDADHSYEGVASDIRSWRTKVKPGGFLIGHDWNLKSVRDAALSVFSSTSIVVGDDHLWTVQC